MRHDRLPARATQRGISTLLISMLLLAILTVITILATSFGLFEQKTSGNEYRYKLAFQAAEAGMNQSIEYLKVNTRNMLSEASGGWLYPANMLWQPCSSVAPATMTLDPCLSEPDSARRASMYRYIGTATGALPLSNVLPGAKMQTFDATGSSSAGSTQFATTYRTFAALCRLDMSTGVPRCSLHPTQEGTFYVTLVSRGQLTDESTVATVKQAFAAFNVLGATPDAPLIASGTAVGLGNAQIIPNPNAGGFTVPISVWSKGNATVDGASFATCNLGEWLANSGTPAPTPDDLLNGVCASCTCNNLCPGYGLLSGNAQSCAAAKAKLEGEDILDVDSNFSDASPKLRDSKYFPSDMFAYMFGVPSSTAVTYLTKNAQSLLDCGTLTSASAGLYWYNSTAACKPANDVGTLQNPVVLVSDGVVEMPANHQFFGVIYVRSTAGTGDLLKASGTPQIYGSVILEGDANLAGSPTIVYNKAVLQNIRNSPSFLRYGPVPGSWSDNWLN
jgi:Tfp pilus assembly protein PilX